ncbi:MAG: prepilin peptidase [Methanophagales archaeon]|nr:prepilin peptidase [Methanophagales archaeon]
MVESNILIVVFCFSCLIYASWRDLKNRSVTNRLWLLMIAVGIPFASYNLFIHRIPFLILLTFSLLFTSALAYLFFRLHLFGGADAKSLICISLLIPAHPPIHFFSHHFPLSLSLNTGFTPLPFALSTLLNATILSLIVPLTLFFYNLSNLRPNELRKDRRYLFIGYRLPVDALSKVKHTRLVHWYEEKAGNVERTVLFGGVEIDNEVREKLNRYAAAGKIGEEVWVTPDLPFMLFVTAGFVSSILYGNFIVAIYSL